jgi:quercetin dioxygenase-like cupin family protein
MVVKQGEGESLNVMGAGVRFLCTADRTQHKWSLMEVSLPEGAGPPPHEHAWDEAYYVVEGEATFSLAGEMRRVRAGDFLYAPAGTVHGFSGASSQPARLLIFDAPAHAESFFRDVDQQVKSPADMGKVAGIGAKHGIHFLPPPPPAS